MSVFVVRICCVLSLFLPQHRTEKQWTKVYSIFCQNMNIHIINMNSYGMINHSLKCSLLCGKTKCNIGHCISQQFPLQVQLFFCVICFQLSRLFILYFQIKAIYKYVYLLFTHVFHTVIIFFAHITQVMSKHHNSIVWFKFMFMFMLCMFVVYVQRNTSTPTEGGTLVYSTALL